MSDRDPEGIDFEAEFLKHFPSSQGNQYGDPKKTRERLKEEKKAGRSPAQRARKVTRDKQINFRASKETSDLLNELATLKDCSQADVIEAALPLLAKLWKDAQP